MKERAALKDSQLESLESSLLLAKQELLTKEANERVTKEAHETQLESLRVQLGNLKRS
jgi:hypothetical protein